MIIDPDHLSVLARDQLLVDRRGRRSTPAIVSSHSGARPTRAADLRAGRRGDAVRRRVEVLRRRVAQDQADARPALLLRLRLGRRHERLRRRRGGPRRGRAEPGHVPVQVVRRQADASASSAAASASATSTWTASRIRPVPGLGRGPAQARRARRSSTTWARGAEAYLQMWERADGRPDRLPAGPRRLLPAAGLAGAWLGASPRVVAAARRASRGHAAGGAWSYCVRRGRITAALTPGGRVGARGEHEPGSQGPRDPNRDEGEAGEGDGVRAGGVRIRRVKGRAFVYGVRGGRVRYWAVATGSASKGRKTLRRYLRLARLR